MAVAAIGSLLVVAGILGLVSLYLGAVTQALSGVQRLDPLPDYQGRPSPEPTDGARPVRYLVLVTGEDGHLTSAFMTQLSAQRHALSLVGLPSNLLVADQEGGDATLADEFADGPASAVRAVETLLQVRIDHFVAIEMHGFTATVDVLGGVTVHNRVEMAADGMHFVAGDVSLNGAQAQVYVGSTKQPVVSLERTEALLVQVVRGIVNGDAMTNPAKVETLGEVLQGCVSVDATLTQGETRRMALEVRLVSDEITGTALPMAGVSALGEREVVVADAEGVRSLTQALRADTGARWVRDNTWTWPSLPALPPR